jgi:predicted TPR repeat methyltransferase
MKKTRKTARRSVAQRSERFGAAYYRKYYLNPDTRVVTKKEMHSRAAMIAAVLHQGQIPVRRILDAGCGIGLLKQPFAEVLPRARYVGLEASEYLCRSYGWVQGSVADYAPARPFDLVVCYDVLQYLSDEQAASAIVNLGRLSQAALYISALTLEDWQENCNRTNTDRDVTMRPGSWYRRRLQKFFDYLGFGVWLRKGVTAILWDMERT